MTNSGVALMGVAELFSASWELFKKIIIKMLLIGLIGLILMAAFSLTAFGLGWILVKILPALKQAVVPFLIGVATIGNIVVFMWASLGWLFAIIKENAGVAECFKLAKGKLLSYLWIAILTLVVVSFGFVLLVIPGIVFAVWFFFSPFVLVEEGGKGWQALQRSRELVRGRWWPVFGRLLILWVISVVISIIPVVGQILSLLLMPFAYIFWYVMYKNLKA